MGDSGNYAWETQRLKSWRGPRENLVKLSPLPLNIKEVGQVGDGGEVALIDKSKCRDPLSCTSPCILPSRPVPLPLHLSTSGSPCLFSNYDHLGPAAQSAPLISSMGSGVPPKSGHGSAPVPKAPPSRCSEWNASTLGFLASKGLRACCGECGSCRTAHGRWGSGSNQGGSWGRAARGCFSVACWRGHRRFVRERSTRGPRSGSELGEWAEPWEPRAHSPPPAARRGL